jgi:hypothetical protein
MVYDKMAMTISLAPETCVCPGDTEICSFRPVTKLIEGEEIVWLLNQRNSTTEAQRPGEGNGG